MKNQLIIKALFLILSHQLVAQNPLAEIKNSISEIKEIYFNQINLNSDSILTKEENREYWKVHELDKHTTAWHISTQSDGMHYTEIYIIKNSELIYAFEEIQCRSNNLEESSVWRCEYFIFDEQVFDYVSLGHGKTEDDAWNPDDIIKQFKNRQAEFQGVFSENQ